MQLRTSPHGGVPSRADATKLRPSPRPVISPPPGRATIAGARFAVFFTAGAWLAYLIEQVRRLSTENLTSRAFFETSVYLVLVTLLTASASAYLLARIGHFQRARTHRRVPRSLIDDFFDGAMPTMTVIIPAYREDERVIRQTLLSAALQEYPSLRVVLLVDDPPNPNERHHRETLERARALPASIAETLRVPRERFEAALERFEHEPSRERLADIRTLEALADEYDAAAEWFTVEGDRLPQVDHSDAFVATEFFGRMAIDLGTSAAAIRTAASTPGSGISRRRVHQLYSRLARIFQADLASFERKQFASLSHEANKAMNLNSYLGLMGGHYRVVSSPGGQVLIPSGHLAPDIIIPNHDYVLTLDADSVLLPEYCLRLVYFMEQPENEDVAVVQTPYSAYPGAGSSIERVAGATTDIQHIVHQGLTSRDATFWVGANAVIRKRALDELLEEEDHAGFTIRRYIKDRTVIEDTESSIDLRARGWRLHNYPERLSYSATPPDFGSLVIQRKRWANGGLVILPKLLALLSPRRPRSSRPSAGELFLRTNYLASISWASIGLLILLAYPFDGDLLSRFAVITALPYFWAMANDLHRLGYSRFDILRVYGFNLLLLPVNLMGTFESIVQGIGGQKMAFARTPKVRNRTVAPWLFIVLPLLVIVWSGHTLLRDVNEGAYVHGAFASVNLVMTLYACLAFIGLRNMAVDLAVNLRDFVYRPVREVQPAPEIPHWASVLYVGSSLPEEVERNAPLAVALAAQDRFGVQSDPFVVAPSALELRAQRISKQADASAAELH